MVAMIAISANAQYNVRTSSRYTDGYGNSTSTHRNQYGETTGTSSSHTDSFGNTTTTHRDRYGNTIGTSSTPLGRISKICIWESFPRCSCSKVGSMFQMCVAAGFKRFKGSNGILKKVQNKYNIFYINIYYNIY